MVRPCQTLEDGVPVLLQAGGEGVQAGQVFGAGGSEPVFEVAEAGGEELGEGSDESARGIEFGAEGADSGQLLPVFIPESVGMAHHPSGDVRGHSRKAIDPGATPPPHEHQRVRDPAHPPQVHECRVSLLRRHPRGARRSMSRTSCRGTKKLITGSTTRRSSNPRLGTEARNHTRCGWPRRRAPKAAAAFSM